MSIVAHHTVAHYGIVNTAVASFRVPGSLQRSISAYARRYSAMRTAFMVYVVVALVDAALVAHHLHPTLLRTMCCRHAAR